MACHMDVADSPSRMAASTSVIISTERSTGRAFCATSIALFTRAPLLLVTNKVLEQYASPMALRESPYQIELNSA